MLRSMCVTVSMLASGSRGNCATVASTRTKILVDAGVSCRETFKRMKALGEEPHSLSAILITHEHSDHIYGLATLAKKLRIPVFLTGATHSAWARAIRDEKGERPQLEKMERFESGHKFQIGDIEVKPFTIPHDAADPVGFSCRAGTSIRAEQSARGSPERSRKGVGQPGRAVPEPSAAGGAV